MNPIIYEQAIYIKLTQNLNDRSCIFDKDKNIIYINNEFKESFINSQEEKISFETIFDQASLLDLNKFITSEQENIELTIKNTNKNVWTFYIEKINFTNWNIWLLFIKKWKWEIIKEYSYYKNEKIWNLDINRYKQIVESMQEWVWVWDENWRTIYANRKFLNMLEYELEEILWRPSFDFRDEESVRTIKENLKKRVKGEISRYEWNLKTKSWQLVPVVCSWTPLPWWWTAWIMTDLREIKSLQDAEEKLKNQLDEIILLQRELNRQIEALNNSAIVVETDIDLTMTNINKSFIMISWYSEEEMIWQKFKFEDPDKLAEWFKENFYKTIKSWNIWKWELKNKSKHWDIYRTWTTVTPFLNNEWQIYKYVFISNDISTIKHLNQIKDEFLNIASHELRTPMTSIKGYVSMILDWDTWEIPSETRLFLERVLSSTKSLIEMVNDMLDLSKLESWNMQFSDETIEINNLLDEIYHDFKIIWEQKKINIIYKENHDLKDKNIIVDRAKLKQVFINIIWNALKFTPTGWNITIKWEDNKDWNVIFEIIDTWIWIPKSHQEKIFEKFKQVDNYLQRLVNWTWLWLSICKQILANYWVDLKVTSEEWKWSTFYFYMKMN